MSVVNALPPRFTSLDLTSLMINWGLELHRCSSYFYFYLSAFMMRFIHLLWLSKFLVTSEPIQNSPS